MWQTPFCDGRLRLVTKGKIERQWRFAGHHNHWPDAGFDG
jgi:hypothetical protein